VGAEPSDGVDVASQLTQLLWDHRDSSLEPVTDSSGAVRQWRFVDASPADLRRALTLLPWVGAARPNGQPPATWLVEAAARFSGLLSGMVAPPLATMRVDAVCVPVAYARSFAAELDRTWWDEEDRSALDLAVAEAWTGWTATTACWQGTGRDVLRGPVPGALLSLWFD
jgi:hypothetical protein